MPSDRSRVRDFCGATLHRRGEHEASVAVVGRYRAECRDQEGALKWVEEFDNLVTTVGKNDLLDQYFNGVAYTQTARMGLKGAGAAAAGDTQASHAGWLEVGLANAPTYSGNRPNLVMGSAAAGVATSSGVVFAITSAGTVAGAFINNGGSATKDDTTGVLYSAGDFTGGSRVVAGGDTLTVTYTATVT